MSKMSEYQADYEFDAFASYSTDPDYRLVRQTESFLESFHKLPVKPETGLSSLNVCVDGSDFRVGRGAGKPEEAQHPVSGLILDNLEKSRRLILFCSGQSAHSPWVEQEVQWFLKHRGPDAILLVVTEGNNPSQTPQECFSDTVIKAGLHEKPWYDFRESKPASRGWSKVKELADERVRLAAHLNNQSAGEILPLWRREENRRQRRRQWITTAVAIVFLALAGAAGLFGYNAEQQRRLVMARLLATQADAHLDKSGDGLQLSLLLATESLRSARTSEGYAVWARAISLAPRRPQPIFDQPVLALDLDSSQTNGLLAVAGSDGLIRIIDVNSSALGRELQLSERSIPEGAQWPGAAVRFSPDAVWLAASAQNRLSIWNTSDWSRQDIEVETEGYFDLAWDQTSERLAIAGYAQPLKLIEVGTWRTLPTSRLSKLRYLKALAFSDQHLITASRSGDIVFWSFGERQGAFESLRIESRESAHDIQVSPNGSSLLIATDSGIHLWRQADIERELGLAQSSGESDESKPSAVNAGSLHHWSVRTAPVHQLNFSPDGQFFLSSSSSRVNDYDSIARLRETSSGHEIDRFHPSGSSVFLDATRVATAGSMASIWDIPPKGSDFSARYESTLQSIAFSPTGRELVIGSEDANLTVLQSGTWEQQAQIAAAGPVATLGFTGDGEWLIATTRAEQHKNPAALQLVSTDFWRTTHTLEHEGSFRAFLSPDYSQIRTSTEQWMDRYQGLKRASRTRIWAISSGIETAWRSHENGHWNPTGKVSIAEGTLPLGESGNPELLDQSEHWQPLRTLHGRAGGMSRSRVGPKEKWLAGFGQGLALLEPNTERRVVNLIPADTRVQDIAFSPDGSWLAVAQDKHLHIWRLGPVEELVKESCRRLGRNLTEDEGETFFAGPPPITCDGIEKLTPAD
jgi:WD40 repeat protein